MVALSNLSRYETALGRSLQRTVDELKRLQRGRQAEHVQTPLASEETHELEHTSSAPEETDDPIAAVLAEFLPAEEESA